MSAPDVKASAYASARIDDEIEQASRDAEKLLHRTFYPFTGTRYFDFPNEQDARSGRLWLDENEIISVTSFVSGGTTIPSTDYFLEPANSGPPYRSINIDRSSTSALSMGSNGTVQRSQVITGVFGYDLVEDAAGTLLAAVSSTTATTITVTASGTKPIGVGALLRVDSERMQVTEKNWLTSGQTGSLTSNMNAQSLAVSDGTVFVIGEELLIDAEQVRVVGIAGNTLTVIRQWNGTSLAAHVTATIYWPRTLTVTRGQAGTTAATHLISAPILRHVVPGPVKELTLAYALDGFFQIGSGMARTIGSGESERAASGRGLRDLEERVYGGYGRRYRRAAV